MLALVISLLKSVFFNFTQKQCLIFIFGYTIHIVVALKLNFGDIYRFHLIQIPLKVVNLNLRRKSVFWNNFYYYVPKERRRNKLGWLR
jgi:hypothetical protein